ncbi:hypothetical protein BLA29_004692 [Euroglyphus maynei]|uniref:Uncharacterized protein n=1 Tax=Euroglyphus maynei TaxID=6958 RepID=A0A1Y3BEY1_EURMA|nr:hypothetical protein BLA29_004692 [Euroglyphus maynei]
MIAIIDQEIIDCKVQLHLLRFKLNQYCAEKKKESNKPDKHSVEDKSIQTIGMEDIAIQVNRNDFVVEKADKFVQKKMTDDQTTNKQLQLQTKPKLLFNNRERQYLERMNRMKQRKQTEENTNAVVEQSRTKITRSVAVETIDPFPQELDLIPFSDQTVYLDLPPELRIKKKSELKAKLILSENEKNHNDVEELSEHLQQSLTTTNHDEKGMNDNTSSLFRTLLPSASNQTASTIQNESHPIQIATGGDPTISKSIMPDDSINTMIDPSITNITFPSMEQSAVDLTNQTILLDDSIDHEKFWHDVFTTAGLKLSKNAESTKQKD